MASLAYSRRLPAMGDYDVLVAGGGPAGSAAAVCAARLGARVALVEASGCLGGMGTAGWVTNFGPMSDGTRPLVGGFTRELVETLYRNGSLGPHVTPSYWMAAYNRRIEFHPEGLKRTLDSFCQEAGVDVFFFTRAVDAITAGRRIEAAVIANVEGLTCIAAKAFIDATGDAALADACGAQCLIAGRDWPYAPATLCSIFGAVNWADPAYGEGSQGIDKIHARVKKEFLPRAIKDGHFANPDPHIMGMRQTGASTASLNAGQMFGVDALSARAISQAMIDGRKLAVDYSEFYRRYVPGCEGLEHLSTAPLLGVRDTRRIVGEFELTFEDYLARRQFDDQVAVYNRPPNVHPTDASQKEFERHRREVDEDEVRLGRGEFLGVPYGILVPKDWENLWVAGRCHSSDTMVHGSIRAQSAAYLMGEAAGTAAKQALDTGQPGCDLDTQILVETLRARGAFLPQTKLSRAMTRSGARSSERIRSEAATSA